MTFFEYLAARSLLGEPRPAEPSKPEPVEGAVCVGLLIFTVLFCVWMTQCVSPSDPNGHAAGARSANPPHLENVRHAPHPAR
jgi:hypothetical protein